MRAIGTPSRERNFPRRIRVAAAALVGGLILTVSGSALARPEFPEIILDELARTAASPDKPASTCIPTCSLCHTSPTPDLSNVGTDIGTSLLAFRSADTPRGGKYPGDITVETLPVFLTALEVDPCPNLDDLACMNMPMCGPCNSDGEGAADIAELRRDLNPNGPGALACPKYGCGARIAPERPTRPLDGAAALAALSAAAVFVRRWRRR